MMRLDKSKLLLFLSDRREFRKVYMEKIEIPPTPHLTRGSFIHKILEDELVKIGVMWEMAKSKEEYISSVLNYLTHLYTSHKKGKGWTNYALFNAYKFLLSFFNKHPFYPLKIERKFEWVDEKNSITFVGKPDAILHLINSHKLLLVDWKVGSFYKRANERVGNWNINTFEANYYVWLMWKLGKKVDEGAIVPLISKKPKLLLITPQPLKFEKVLYGVVEEIRKFLKENDFPEDEL